MLEHLSADLLGSRLVCHWESLWADWLGHGSGSLLVQLWVRLLAHEMARDLAELSAILWASLSEQTKARQMVTLYKHHSEQDREPLHFQHIQ